MQEQFSYPNVMEMPRIDKVVINMGVGEAVTDSKKIDAAAREMTLIAGQKPIIIKAKRSVATFKLREGMPVGVKVTLRRDSASEINKAEFKIVALENSTSQQFVEKNLSKATLIKTPNYDEAIDMVLNDEVDLMVAGMTTCILAVMRNPDSNLATLKAPLK